MSNALTRIGTANMYDNTLRNLGERQSAWWDCRKTSPQASAWCAPATTRWPPRRPNAR